MRSPLRFRKRPVVVEAMRWDGPELASRAHVVGWINRNGGWAHVDETSGQLNIGMLDDTMRVAPGDWVVRGTAGEFYPCKPDIFEATHEPA